MVTCVLLYLYDLHFKSKKGYPRLKRAFYRALAKSPLATRQWATKSALLVEEELESAADEFFMKWAPDISVVKAKVETVEKLV